MKTAVETFTTSEGTGGYNNKPLNQFKITMKTAVEWLIDEHFGGIENCTPDFRFHIQQAIELNKNQIVNAVDTTIEKMNVLENFRTLKNGEQYYNEIFKEQ
jgi:hypothetical protein